MCQRTNRPAGKKGATGCGNFPTTSVQKSISPLPASRTSRRLTVILDAALRISSSMAVTATWPWMTRPISSQHNSKSAAQCRCRRRRIATGSRRLTWLYISATSSTRLAKGTAAPTLPESTVAAARAESMTIGDSLSLLLLRSPSEADEDATVGANGDGDLTDEPSAEEACVHCCIDGAPCIIGMGTISGIKVTVQAGAKNGICWKPWPGVINPWELTQPEHGGANPCCCQRISRSDGRPRFRTSCCPVVFGSTSGPAASVREPATGCSPHDPKTVHTMPLMPATVFVGASAGAKPPGGIAMAITCMAGSEWPASHAKLPCRGGEMLAVG
mmetsp:Transcript_48897/g.140504  ORF Transcript_48897/g.140504 Transcript_48897/m.140504 type:complete len:330 (+) Transcript_48897:608-1597(+)